jgi:Fe-S-cluster containining protein
MRQLRKMSADPRQESGTPCNGCTSCCYFPGPVDVIPDDEQPEDLAHLDLVDHPDGDGRLALRKRPDGACVHLGPTGCTVHAHRPLACRTYDCRLLSLCGVHRTYEGGHEPPIWHFDVNTSQERVLKRAFELGARKYIYEYPDGWDAENAVVSSSCSLIEMIPIAKDIEELPEAEREMLTDYCKKISTKSGKVVLV